MRSTALSTELVLRYGGAAGASLADLNATVQQLAFGSAFSQCQSLRESLL